MSGGSQVDARRPDRPTDPVALLAASGDHPLMMSFPHGAVFTFDTDLRYLSAGGLGLADVGLSRDMLEGRTIHEVFPPETVDVIEPYYRAALDGVSTTMDVPYDGRRYLQWLAPVRDSTGRIVAGLGFTQDVTDARNAEQAFRESEERNRLTFNHAPIGEALVELDGRWRSVNPAVTALTGYSEAELLGMTFQDITHPEDLDLDLGHLNQLIADEITSYQIEKRYYTASGRIVWVLLSVSLVRDRDGSPLYFISQIQDITERKRQHDALQDLTAMVAHDLRAPTMVISGFADLLETSWATLDDEERKSFVGKIKTASKTLQALLENSLTASTLDAHALEATPSKIDLGALVHDVLTTLHADLPDVDTHGIQPCTVWADPAQLIQVLSNLLSNAAKYGGDLITIETKSEDGAIQLTVRDNGDGVDPEFVPHLFDRFSRSESARRGTQRGSGLGLYIVRDLLTLNGASIRYDVGADGGSAFEVTLPMAAE